MPTVASITADSVTSGGFGHRAARAYAHGTLLAQAVKIGMCGRLPRVPTSRRQDGATGAGGRNMGRTEQRKLVQRGLRAFGLALAFAASGALAAVGVNKTFNPTNVSAGQSSTLTVILLNNNVAAATAVAFTDNLPGTVVVANPANASTTCGAVVTAIPGATISRSPAERFPRRRRRRGPVHGAGRRRVADIGVFINNIPAGAVSSSQGTNPQNANATLTVAALRPVTGAKAFAPANLHGGGTASTVTLTLTNPNSVALTERRSPTRCPRGSRLRRRQTLRRPAAPVR